MNLLFRHRPENAGASISHHALRSNLTEHWRTARARGAGRALAGEVAAARYFGVTACGARFGPRTARELVEAAVKLATALDGRTPHASLQALLYVEAKKPDGLFIRPPDTKGVFDLRERSPKLRAVR